MRKRYCDAETHAHSVTVYSRAGTFGAIVEYGAEKKVSQHSWLAASVAVGIPSGVTLKIK
jgi:DnaJ family protein C protein 11